MTRLRLGWSGSRETKRSRVGSSECSRSFHPRAARRDALRLLTRVFARLFYRYVEVATLCPRHRDLIAPIAEAAAVSFSSSRRVSFRSRSRTLTSLLLFALPRPSPTSPTSPGSLTPPSLPPSPRPSSSLPTSPPSIFGEMPSERPTSFTDSTSSNSRSLDPSSATSSVTR